MLAPISRSFAAETIDDPGLPDDLAAEVHRNLTMTHLVLGNVHALVDRIRRSETPVKTVLDIGCGDGGILRKIRDKLGIQVTGVDLRQPSTMSMGIPIVVADATRDPLPESDVAIAVCVIHHLDDESLKEMVRNVGRYCRRFIILDLVRHRLPIALFRTFMCPWLHPINCADGVISIQRSYRPGELRKVVESALVGTQARFIHTVAPLYMRQIVDIRYC